MCTFYRAFSLFPRLESQPVRLGGDSGSALEVLEPGRIYPDHVFLIRLEPHGQDTPGLLRIIRLPGHLRELVPVLVAPGPALVHHGPVEGDGYLLKRGVHVHVPVLGHRAYHPWIIRINIESQNGN